MVLKFRTFAEKKKYNYLKFIRFLKTFTELIFHYDLNYFSLKRKSREMVKRQSFVLETRQLDMTKPKTKQPNLPSKN